MTSALSGVAPDVCPNLVALIVSKSVVKFTFGSVGKLIFVCAADAVHGSNASGVLGSASLIETCSFARLGHPAHGLRANASLTIWRSEERRVGKEGRSRWVPYHLKKKNKKFLYRGLCLFIIILLLYIDLQYLPLF